VASYAEDEDSHCAYDTIKREEAVRALKPGQQNPFLIGSENYQNYLTMMQIACWLTASLEGRGAP
jgi:hypothetical protein